MSTESPTMLEVAQQVLDSQPFSRLVGARLTHFEKGVAEICITLTENHLQQHGTAHGGVLSYAADTAIAFAAGSVDGPVVLSAEMKINYLRGSRHGDLLARAEVVHAGASLITVKCDIVNRTEDDDKLCAIAQGTVAVRR